MKLKEYLRNKLTKEEAELVPSSFDVVGDIAIFVEFPDELKKKQKIVGEALLEMNANLGVVCKKVGKYTGKYRTAKLEIIAGEKRKETIHVENGCKYMLDVEKVYFSPRSGNERQRISNLVKEKENVLVMFAGCGAFTIQVAKRADSVTAIEANPTAHAYALKNVKLNKIGNVKTIKGDVTKVIPKLKETFDRIIMPLPKDAQKFLPDALKVAKKGSRIHLYQFGSDDDIETLKKDIENVFELNGKKCKFMNIAKAGEYAPHVHRLCFDILVS
ncbi:MAG TPA: class I SAM-dependent methyltransferase family protein [Candidatus Nanoarchaeia archaeon]|nr:class I SAM-dependent methyltransferase family protein [Candidatus Nanoarchaeia archaeon]